MKFQPARILTVALALITIPALASAPAASAAIPSYTVTVDKVGNGLVTGSGINCGSDCQETWSGDCAYDPQWGEVVCDNPQGTLTASNANGFTFDHWDGCTPANSSTCDVFLNDDTTVTAYFNDVQDPTVALTDPATTAARTGTITLGANAADNGSVDRVEFYVRGVKVGTDTTAPYSMSFDTTSIAEGPALVEAMAVDGVARTSAKSGRTITIDNSDPVVTITSGPDGGTYGPNATESFTFTASDAVSGVQKVECKLDGGSFGACSGVGSHSVSTKTDGTHTLTVRATDNAGRTAEKSRSWTTDATFPDVSITKPTAGAKHGTIDIAATATDASGIQKVEFWAGGVKLAEDTTAPYETTFDTATLPDGATPTIEARAFDGYTGVSIADLQITIDNGAPSLQLDGPDGQTFAPHTTQTWTFAAADATSGVAQVRCSIDGGAFGPCSDDSSIVVENAAGGGHTLDIRVTDAAGNEKTFRRTWTIDATGPVTQITSGPADGTTLGGNAVEFAFTADEGATFRCRVYPSGLTPPAFGDCSAAAKHAASGFAPGTYVFEVIGTDAYGNQGAAVKRTFTVPGAAAGDKTTPGGGSAGTGTGEQRVDTPVVFFFDWHSAKGTRVVRLKAGPVAAGVKVSIACKGRGCSFKTKTGLAVKGGYVNLAPLFKKKLLRPGAVITVTMAKEGAITKTLRFTIVKRKAPKVRAL